MAIFVSYLLAMAPEACQEMAETQRIGRFPSWVGEAVVYQVFPDRFCRSGLVDAQRGLLLQPWGTEPEKQGFQGGDLYGVIDSLDHLQRLGVTCLYLTPVFSSAANHRYHAYNYYEVDPLLGGNKALDALIAAVHQRGMRLILDGVFNHCGRGFWAFHHLLENGDRSPYRDWFHVYEWPLRPYPRKGQSCGYSCWWNDPALPKFNHHHPAVKEYLLAIGKHWLERGIDGWRLDVPDEVPAAFWLDFRRMVKGVNPEAWIVGEIWGDARPWLQGEHFDGVMNYRVGWSSLCWVAGSRLRRSYRNPMYPLQPLDTAALLEIWSETQGWYCLEVNRSQLNLLDSHDVPRALNTLKGDVSALALALLLLMLQPGAPCLYYGTEVGLDGGAEPACREAMPWGAPWPHDLCQTIQALIQVRQQIAAVQDRGLSWQASGSDGLIGRGPGVVIVVNRSRTKGLRFDPQELDQDLWGVQALVGNYQASRHTLSPQSAVLFRGTDEQRRS